ncbi:adenosine deaminase [Bdellovibrionota bacterium FG-1]
MTSNPQTIPQTELHRHLDVSIRSSTLLRLAQARGLEGQSTSLEQFRKKILITQPMRDLNTVLAQFSLFSKVLDRPEVLEQVAFECVEDCFREGTRQVELRFSPTFVTEFSKLPWPEVLDSFERGLELGMKKYPEIRAGLICIASREFGIDEVAKTVEFFLDHSSRFIGLDMAGNEADFPCRLFESIFKKPRAKHANITIHAGEASGPDNMWAAIELLGARRIGHGLACIQDPQLIEYLRKHRIYLEMCPTSNWLTQASPDLKRHPLPTLLRAGVAVSINTDDPGIFDVTLPGEINVCKNHMDMTSSEIAQCLRHAAEASFFDCGSYN